MWAGMRPWGTHPRALAAGGLAALLAASLLVLAPGADAAPTRPPRGPERPAPTSSAAPTSAATTSPAQSSSSAPTTAGPATTRPAPAPYPRNEPVIDPVQDVVPPPAFTEAISGALPGQDQLVAEAKALTESLAATNEELAKLNLEADAAGDVYRQAEAELAMADERAVRARRDADAADLQLQRARDELGRFARNSYIGGTRMATDLLLLDATSPSDLVARAGLLESVADSQTEALDRVMRGQARSQTAGELAEEALTSKADAESRARVALDESTRQLAAQEETLGDLQKQKDDLDAQLYDALAALVGPEGAALAFAQYESDLYATDAAAALARRAANAGGPVLSGAWALPLEGRLTSCFCQRWGTMHWGIDIAAPMYTPMFSAGNGTVIRAGEATGFGLAVYIQHDNGDVTVYGHMEVITVTTGQRVAAGQEIALVGTRGFSTGPHLHFEVYVGGLDGPRVDPVVWLADRGIFV